jgi:hypothetical protein
MKVQGEDGGYFDPKSVKPAEGGEVVFVSPGASELHLLLDDEIVRIDAAGRRVTTPAIAPRFSGHVYRTSDKALVDLIKGSRAFKTGRVMLLQDVIDKRVERESDRIVAQLKSDPATKARVAQKLKAEVGATAPQVA